MPWHFLFVQYSMFVGTKRVLLLFLFVIAWLGFAHHIIHLARSLARSTSNCHCHRLPAPVVQSPILPRYAMSCYFAPRHATPCHVTPYPAMPCHALPCHDMTFLWEPLLLPCYFPCSGGTHSDIWACLLACLLTCLLV